MKNSLLKTLFLKRWVLTLWSWLLGTRRRAEFSFVLGTEGYKCLLSINCFILLFGIKKTPIYPPEIILTNWPAPSPARPTNADNPSVLPNVGANARPNDKFAVKRLPPTCFLILVLASIYILPFFNSRFFSDLFTTFDEHTTCHFQTKSPSWLSRYCMVA